MAACVSRGWRSLLSDELLWRDLCRREWGIDAPLWPDGMIHSSFRCGSAWRHDFVIWLCPPPPEEATVQRCMTPNVSRLSNAVDGQEFRPQTLLPLDDSLD